jgi:SAM-dependent methyltransferase
LHVLDLGCGSGQYGVRLQGWSGGRIARYAGVDLQPHPGWTALSASHPFLAFRTGSVEDLDRFITPDANLVVSQSTLEHVGDDLACFDHLHAAAHARGQPMLQIHLVPSAACLPLYLWHGYRQYTPRTLSAITSRFADCSERWLVRLGGTACNRLHARWITRPLLLTRTDRRDIDPIEYRQAVADAIERDMRVPQASPAFHAILIYSNGSGAPMPRSSCWRVAGEDGHSFRNTIT